MFIAFLLSLNVTATHAQEDPPPPDVQDCMREPIKVEAQGLPFRDAEQLCDPIPYMSPDPCSVTWGVGMGQTNDPSWRILNNDVPPPNGLPYSACWRWIDRMFTEYCVRPGGPESGGMGMLFDGTVGYPLNINLFATPSIGDFLPPSTTIGGGSTALLPPGAAEKPTGWRGLDRPTQSGAVDLITGMPLAKFTDLELPFGGASFRLCRTRSQSQHIEEYTCAGADIIDSWWDWAGNGWMISEAPLLLVDSAIADVVGNNPRTSYLVLDAHHSIPFQRLDDRGEYEAPARFRARLTHNGSWSAGQWAVEPTEYTAWLYDGALKYTFLVVRQDVPDNRWDPAAANVPCTNMGTPSPDGTCVSSLHARPFLPQQFDGGNDWWDPRSTRQNPGQGVPFYALCTRIEDTYGHVVDISFGPQTQYAMDNPQSEGCVECMQDCPGKGQIRSIRLRKGNNVYWTLMYRYRTAPRDPFGQSGFRCDDDPELPHLVWQRQIMDRFDHLGTRVLDSVFVYRGDVPEVDTQPNTSYTIQTSMTQYDPMTEPTVEALDFENQTAQLPQPLQGWLHRVRYHYAFQYDLETTYSYNEKEGMLHEYPRLLKTTLQSRREDNSGQPVTSEIVSTRARVLQYLDTSNYGYEAWLAAIYEPDAVDRAISMAREYHPAFGPNLLALALDDMATSQGTFVSTLHSELIPKLIDAATIRWTPGPYLGTTPGNLRQMLPNGKPPYVRTDEAVHVPSYQHQTGTMVVAGSDGQPRYFRFRRLQAGADAEADPSHSPHRSVFHVPYSWHAYGPSADVAIYSPPSDYTSPRWITFVDEFDRRETMTGTPDLSGDYWTSEGLVSRRVVHIGASGVILRDHHWTFKDGQLVESGGSGLGAENVYWAAPDFLAAAGMELPPPPPPLYIPGTNIRLPSNDHLAGLRGELLLMEERSVGWSVAENSPAGPNDGFHKGFVKFHEYEALRFDSDPAVTGADLGNGWFTDTEARIEERAKGIKEGQAYTRINNGPLANNDAGGPRLYTHEYFRPQNPAEPGGIPASWTQPDDPALWEFTCDVQYLTPVENGARLTSIPVPGEAPHMSASARPEATVACTYLLTKRRAFDPMDPRPAFSRPIDATLTIGPARQQRPGGPWYFPVDREQFNIEGSVVRTISGLVRNPLNPSAVSDELQSLAHTITVYDAEGRTRHLIADVGVGINGELPSHDDLNTYQTVQRPQAGQVTPDEVSAIPSWPLGWPRIEVSPPRNYVTTYVYGGPGGRPSDVYFPNGRRWASRIIVISKNEFPLGGSQMAWNNNDFTAAHYNSTLEDIEEEQWYAREYIFNELELSTDNGTVSTYSRMIGEVRDYNNRYAQGNPITTRRVFFARGTQFEDIQNPEPLGAFLDGPRNDQQPHFLEERRVEYGIDTAGRLTRAELLEMGPGGVMVSVGSKVVYDLVDVIREYGFDGTITRTTRNLLGQPIRKYVGTEDPGWNSVPSTTTGLALVERYEYGSSVNDAWLQTITRKYTRNPGWAEEPFSEVGSTDEYGYVTKTSYDWHMRPVRVDQFGETTSGNRDIAVAPRLTTTLTYLDAANRPLVVAEFGSGVLSLPEEIDPVLRREWLPTQPERPVVSALYALAIKPTSVIEYFYGPDGKVVEKRSYHYHPTLPQGQQLTWHEEHTLQGRGGKTVYEQRPAQPIESTTLDGLARPISTVKSGWNGLGWTRALSRSDFLLDADGNVCGTSIFERLIDDDHALRAEAVDGIGPNAVRSRSVAWFDPQKRQTASADLGTESRGVNGTGPDTMTACPEVYERVVDDGNQSEPHINATGQGNPTIERVDVPDWAELSINRYSLLTGRLIWSTNPDGSTTEMTYDKAGRISRRTENRFPSPGQLTRVTEYEYTLGRLTGVVVSRTDGLIPLSERQVTRLVYGAHVLSEIPSNNPNTPPTYALSDVHVASHVGRMHLPSPADGEPTFPLPPVIPPVHEDPGLDSGEVVLRYTFDGQIGERIDGRGVAFRYFYDSLNRLTWVVAGSYSGNTFQQQLPTSLDSVTDRVMSIQYRYDSAGRLADVIARASASIVISHTKYEYDQRGNLTREWQGQGALLTASPPASTPSTEYAWSYQATNTPTGLLGYDRLAAITYPRPPEYAAPPPGNPDPNRRKVSFTYGAANGPDDRLSRLVSVSTTAGSTTQSIAQFTYAGVNRRVVMTLSSGNGAVTADLRTLGGQGQPFGITGLDSFGRIRDLHYKNKMQVTLFRAEHAYDMSGNRVYERVTQWPAPALHDGSQYVSDARSQLCAYDSLDRLTAATVGRLQFPSGVPEIVSATRSDTWSPDLLGNWQAVPGTPPAALGTGRYTQGNLDGYDPPAAVAPIGGTSLSGSFLAWQDSSVDAVVDESHSAPVTDGRNEVLQVLSRASCAGPWQTTTPVLHDAAGNLIFDGTYVYHYDAWNRLVQVSAGAIDPNATPVSGQPYSALKVGPSLKHYVYDGLGRLVRTQSPLPNPAASSGGSFRTERFYYDGIRRIQETRQDLTSFVVSNSELERGPGSLTTMAHATLAMADDVGQPLILQEPTLSAVPIGGAVTLAREYIWGPGDAWHAAQFDELLVYFGEGRVAWWPLQDAAGDTAAIVAPGTSAEQFRAVVFAQMRYDAYGQVISADHLRLHAFLSVGHKGLFYDRLDRGLSDGTARGSVKPPYSDSGAPVETPRLVPFARGVYHVRNRSVIAGGGSPALMGLQSIVPQGPPESPTWALSQSGLSSGAAVHGRFMQADPNATALVLAKTLVFHGEVPSPSVDEFDLEVRFSDGANLYQYLGSNPWNSSDPLGLYDLEDGYDGSEMFEDFTDIMGMLDPMPGPSDFIRSVLQSMVEEYSANLSWDVEWATDWSTGDDWHSRLDNRWVTLAILRGLYDAFTISLPFGDGEVNPLDAFASASGSSGKRSNRSISTRWGTASFSRHVQVDGYRATVFNNPAGGRKLIRFDADSIKHKVNIPPHNHRKEIKAANKRCGYTKTPRGWVWHHHWKSGEMHLVPRRLHAKAGHVGRAQGWPAERFP